MEDNKKEILMQSKSIVNTSYNVTAIQNRIFYNCLFNAQKEQNGALCCHVSLEKLKSLIPSKNQRTLSAIKETFVILKQTSLLFEKIDGGDRVEYDYNLLIGTEYNTNKEEFKIFFPEKLYNHIMEYTVYAPLNLDILSKFRGFYSQRLYESLRLWSRTGQTIQHEFTVEHLRFVLGTEDKYPLYNNFKERVLNQAIKEINEKGNMSVDFEEISKNRKIIKVRFIIKDNEPKTYFKGTKVENSDLIEVDTTLYDGGKEVAVKQKAFNLDEDKKITSTVAPAEVEIFEMIKYTCIPDTHIFNSKFLDEFTVYCYNNSISFCNDKDYLEILRDAQEAFKKAKEVEIIKNKGNYNYFLGIFKNKHADLIERENREIEKEFKRIKDMN